MYLPVDTFGQAIPVVNLHIKLETFGDQNEFRRLN